MADKMMKTLTLGGNKYEIVDGYARTEVKEISNTLSQLTLKNFGINATAAEINILKGATATTDELNILKGVTATTDELNRLDGITATTDELNHCKGVTSSIQAQLNGKASSDHGPHVTYSTTAPVMDGTASVGSAPTVSRSDHRHPTDTSRASASSLTELKNLVGNTAVQTQINNAVSGITLTGLGGVKKSGDTMTGDLTVPNLKMYGSNTDKTIEVFSSGNALACGILLDADDNKRRISFNSYNKDQDGNTNKFYERYLLPNADSGLTETKRYEILTTKNVKSGTSLPSTGAQGDIFFLYST